MHVVPFPDLQLPPGIYGRVDKLERPARKAEDLSRVRDRYDDLRDALLCRAADPERLFALAMAYDLWQRRHLLVYLTLYDFKRSLCDENTVALSDSRLSEVVDKFAFVEDEHQQPIAFKDLRRHHLLDSVDDALVKAKSEANTERCKQSDMDRYKVEDPDEVMRRKPRQLSDTTIAKDGARRAIDRLQHESEEAKDKGLGELVLWMRRRRQRQ